MFLAWKELMHSKTKFTMLAVIFILISWLVFLLSGLGNGLSTLAASTFKNMQADYVVFQQGSKNSMGKSLISGDLSEQIVLMDDVTAASPMGISMASAVNENDAVGEDKVDIAIVGIIPGSFLQPNVIEGEGLTADQPTHVIVNDTLKDAGYKLGDTFKLDGSTESLTIIGFVKDQTYNHVASVFTPISEWQKIAFAAPGSDKGIVDPVNAIMLQGSKIDPENINQQLTGTDTVTRQAAVQGMPGYKEENGTILMMLAFLLAISAFVLGVFFYVMTLQKSNQFGIMKAIGAKNKFLYKAVISQVFILSVISIVIGILLTYGTAAIMPKEMPFALDTTMMIAYSIALLIISILSSLVSVRMIAKIDPLKALGRVE